MSHYSSDTNRKRSFRVVRGSVIGAALAVSLATTPILASQIAFAAPKTAAQHDVPSSCAQDTAKNATVGAGVGGSTGAINSGALLQKQALSHVNTTLSNRGGSVTATL